MLVIRLQRIGKKHQPSYRLIVAERRSKLIAPPVEDLGSYNPNTKQTTLNKERVKYWIEKGARPSLTAHNLLVKEGALDAAKMQMIFKVKVKEGVESAPAPVSVEAEAAPAEAEAKTPIAAEPTV